ncbi:hypothetical protein F5Y18DRAFT_78962 [Xylariaceae sp. FL1019]|nr:hypothetical protein F5Y18DRAFT_78962 [Xylariaceae sp. FL1019]
MDPLQKASYFCSESDLDTFLCWPVYAKLELPCKSITELETCSDPDQHRSGMDHSRLVLAYLRYVVKRRDIGITSEYLAIWSRAIDLLLCLMHSYIFPQHERETRDTAQLMASATHFDHEIYANLKIGSGGDSCIVDGYLIS